MRYPGEHGRYGLKDLRVYVCFFRGGAGTYMPCSYAIVRNMDCCSESTNAQCSTFSRHCRIYNALPRPVLFVPHPFFFFLNQSKMCTSCSNVWCLNNPSLLHMFPPPPGFVHLNTRFCDSMVASPVKGLAIKIPCCAAARSQKRGHQQQCASAL